MNELLCADQYVYLSVAGKPHSASLQAVPAYQSVSGQAAESSRYIENKSSLCALILALAVSVYFGTQSDIIKPEHKCIYRQRPLASNRTNEYAQPAYTLVSTLIKLLLGHLLCLHQIHE